MWKKHWPFPRKKNKMKANSYIQCGGLSATNLCQTTDVQNLAQALHYINWTRFSLTLARRNGFLHTEGRGWYNPLTVSPLIELELREKKRACRPLEDTAIYTNIKCLRSTGILSI